MLMEPREIVSVTRDNPRHRYTYRDAFRACASWPIAWRAGDWPRAIVSLPWPGTTTVISKHTTPSACSGYVCHTINPRLFPEQLVYIINHADDQYVFLDPDFLPLVEGFADAVPGVKGWIVLTSEEHMPDDRVCPM